MRYDLMICSGMMANSAMVAMYESAFIYSFLRSIYQPSFAEW